MAAPPEAMLVARLVDGDPVDPGAERRLSAEAMNGPEHAKEDFLGEVERFVPIAEEIHRKLDDHALVLADQIGARRLVARDAALHEGGFAAVDVGPTGDPGVFVQEFPSALHHAGNSFHYNQFRPRPRPKV